MKYFSFTALLCLSVGTFFNTAHAANTYLTNPFGLAYGSVTNVSWYGRPGGMLITSGCNRYDAAFATARANGAEILAYLDPVEVTDYRICTVQDGFYNGNPATVPRWPYPSYGARINWPNTHLTDIRRGSVWSNKVVAYVENLMRENKVDGVFLDVLGARLWSSNANWGSWPQWEKDAWTDGAVDLARRLDASRRAINPRFIIVNNNVWDRGDSRGTPAEKYVDGVVIEHHASTSTYHKAYVGRAFGNLGHRRVLVIGKSTTDARAWIGVQGVTHVSDEQSYKTVTAPPVAFHRLTDRPKKFGRTSVGTVISGGLPANAKRGSRFSLSDKATLLRMSAHLDGYGGPSGSQSLRMAVYKDNGGVPGSLMAQSSAVSFAANTSSRWVNFPASAVKLYPGSYWIVIHSGTSTAIARSRSDGLANWRGNTDTYSDGAANPFGTGSAGTSTLSINVSYTVGH